MLNDAGAPPSAEKFSFKSPTLTSYQKSFDMFCITPTVLQLFAENRLDHCRDSP
jgi:hypothetical protein